MRRKDPSKCSKGSCSNPAVGKLGHCFDHMFSGRPLPVEQRTPRQVYQWDIVCLLCALRRPARGTVEDARFTSARLRNQWCARCGGIGLVVENAEVGSTSSPTTVHSPLYVPSYGGRIRQKVVAA